MSNFGPVWPQNPIITRKKKDPLNHSFSVQFFTTKVNKQFPVRFLFVWLLSHLNWNVHSSKKQTSFTLFCDYNYGEKEKKKKMKPFHFNAASNGSSDFSDTFLVKCSQLLSSFETPPFFCLEYFFIHTTLIWPWTRKKKSFLYLKYRGTIVESILNELF